MGWLFGRKKVVPRVPFPQGRALDEKALEFPSMDSSDRVIEPDKVKEAVGFSKPMAFPEEEESMPMPEEEAPETPRFPFAPMPKYNRTAAAQELMPKHELYVKVEVYQRMLSELDELRRGFVDLQQINKSMGESEYNEERSLEKLRRDMKSVHDKLLHIDKKLFKYQGE